MRTFMNNALFFSLCTDNCFLVIEPRKKDSPIWWNEPSYGSSLSLLLLKGFSLFNIYILCVDILTCVCQVHDAHRGQRSTGGVFFNYFSTLLYEGGSFTKAAADSVRLAGQPQKSSCLSASQVLGLQARTTMPDLYVETRDLNSGPQAFLISTFPTESPSWHGFSQF